MQPPHGSSYHAATSDDDFDGNEYSDAVEVDEEAEDYYSKPKVVSPRKSRILAAFVGIITLIGVGVAVYFLVGKDIGGSTSRHPDFMGTVNQSQLALHNEPQDCWVAYYGDVYDMTKHAPKHPGGPEWITDFCGTDGTRDYAIEHERELLDTIPETYLGVLANSTEIKSSVASSLPTSAPTSSPVTSQPSTSPTSNPITTTPPPATSEPTENPSSPPTTGKPTDSPSSSPITNEPTENPSSSPTTGEPTETPTSSETAVPSSAPSTSEPTETPTSSETAVPSSAPTTIEPTKSPFMVPTTAPTSGGPTHSPTLSEPTERPISSAPPPTPPAGQTSSPVASSLPPTTLNPTPVPTEIPSSLPTPRPTAGPTLLPTASPTLRPTARPTFRPTARPTLRPTARPTLRPTARPTFRPTARPTLRPTEKPTRRPTHRPTPAPVCTEPVFTLSQVSQHDSADDCWYALYRKVYDMTDFAAFFHPGGARRITNECGTDAVVAFESTKGHNERLMQKERMDQYLLGTLGDRAGIQEVPCR